VRDVDLPTFASARADGAMVIDVREPMEYLSGHVPGAQLIPMGQLASRQAEIPRNSPVYVICASGNRSSSMTSFLVQAGYNAWSVAGGTSAWISADMPVVVGRHANVA
jgi:rhodanese-related sulfurtransferase